MQLDRFIAQEMDAILKEWEAFAATLFPASRHVSKHHLQDHARQILEAIARDLSAPQSPAQMHEKSWGKEAPFGAASETAAAAHAFLRARDGFDVCQLAAEYRALRASVLRLWMERCAPESPPDIVDMVRFNEAIDQSLAQAIRLFSDEVDHSRNLLLGALGHDMRSPLQTIRMTARALAMSASPEISLAADRLTRSSASLQRLVTDLLDYNRTKLGFGIDIVRTRGSLREIVAHALDQLRAAYPGKTVVLDAPEDSSGNWDTQRLQQLLGNLVVNAFKYGTAGEPVHVRLGAAGDRAVLSVRNVGRAIQAVPLDQIFDPFSRGDRIEGERENGSLGLGLYIAREIAKAHAGSIEVTSNDTETVFIVTLPTNASPDTV